MWTVVVPMALPAMTSVTVPSAVPEIVPPTSAVTSPPFGKGDHSSCASAAAAGDPTIASASTSVRVRDGDLVIADGPFAETKEQIAGYFVVEAKDLDEAIDLASLIPAASHGTIEVRPVWEM